MALPPLALAGDTQFGVTRWSMVVAARGNGPDAREAMEFLCTHYWYPLYAFVRRQGHNAQNAQDLTQSFFARLLDAGWFDGIAQEKGKFRSYLLASMKHFIANERERANAQKRGGGRSPLSLDAQAAESRYAMEPVDHLTPEKVFERRWALTLLNQVLNRLGEEHRAAGKSELFEALKPTLTGEQSPYAQVGEKLGMTEGAVKVAAHRLRQRYRELIREEVAQTIDGSEDIDAELRDLMSALSS